MFELTDAMLENAIKTKCFPGAALRIGKGEKVLHTKYIGKFTYDENATKVGASTIYDMASITKIVCTTMLVLKLIETGKLYLQDTLPLFYDNVPEDKKHITIENLLTHSSGIIWHFFLEEKAKTPKDAARAILDYPLSYETKSRTEYSCMGFILLKEIIEKLYDKPLDKAFLDEVATPLGMNNTFFCPNKDLQIVPSEILANKTVVHKIVNDENARFLNGVSTNAGVFSNLDDMSRFVKMLACFGKHENEYFLSPAIIKAATRNYTKGCGHNRGLGFKLYGGTENFMGDLLSEQTFGHTGFTGTSFAVEPQSGLWVVLLSNATFPARGNADALRFRRLIYNQITAEFYKAF